MVAKSKKTQAIRAIDFLAPSTYTSVSRRDWDNMQRNAIKFDPSKFLKIGKRSKI
jgi:hypothetical protein